MNCSNCGRNEATVKVIQVINGVKTELFLCDTCAEDIGFENINLNLPIDFSSFISEFFDNYNQDELLTALTANNNQKCENCGLTYDEFVKTGKLGCINCYNVFKDRIDLITKNIQGSSLHIGRGVTQKENFSGDEINEINHDNDDKNNSSNVNKANNKENNINTQKSVEYKEVSILKDKLKKAIKDERYEDAAKIRDEIKKFNI